MYYLIKSPEAMRKAQAEVDDLLGDQQLQVEDLHKLPYLTGNFSRCLWLAHLSDPH